MRARRLVSGLAFAACLSTLSSAAHAQKYVMSGVGEIASGIEGGGGRTGTIDRAPTRLRFGGDLHIDESPEDVFGLAALVNLEPRTAFGIDVRYIRVFEQHYAVSIGAAGYITPGTLVGPAATFEARHQLAKSLWFTAGPEVNVFVVGVDLPDKTVLWQALIHVGIRVDL